MKTIFTKSITKALTLVVVIALTLGALTSCGILGYIIDGILPATVGAKEEILLQIEESLGEGKSSGETAEEYLHDWSLPKYDRMKFSYVELCFNQLYNLEGGLPDTLTHAAETAKLFIEHYYDIIDHDDKTAVTDALLYCYVAVVGDPYSVYRPPVESESFNDEMSGSFGGIGVVVEYNHNEESIMINTVYPDSPAEKAGLKVGDYIYAVDGRTVEELGYTNAVYYVRGEIGTTVDVTVLRDGKLVTCTATRERVEEINVDYEFDPETKMAYIYILSFKENTFNQFKESVDKVLELGAEGIVFDLRNNPGGYVQSVLDVVSYLVPSGHTILSYQYKGREQVFIESYDDIDGVDHVVDLPMVVLCNEYTASSGEIFTSAIRDFRDAGLIDAMLVGTNTFGKGIMQSSYYYTDGSTITLTVSYFNPPCGVNYHGTGIAPDLEVELSESEDNQLKAAYEQLKALIDN
jgi:carboxyl-terminal processing protease